MSDSWLKPYEEALPSDMIVMPVIAYRIWYVPLQPILQMRSYHIQTPWTPCQRLEAECRNHMSCVCAGEFWTSTKREAFGKVYLWGRVIECEKGFRGLYAYPAGLYYTADNSKSLCEMYRVPLLTIKDHHKSCL